MKKMLFLSLIAVVSTAFYPGGPATKEKPRLRMAVHYRKNDRTDTTTYSYTADGRISCVQSSTDQNFGSIYHYLPGMVIRRYHEDIRHRTFTDTMILNKAGLVERIASTNPSVNGLWHTYNETGQLLRSENKSGDGISLIYTDYQYAGGNRVSEATISGTNEISSGTFQYYPDKPNTTGNENLGLRFAGADSKNPEKYRSYRMAGQIYNGKSYYHYDEQERIRVRASYDVTTGELLDSTLYTYYTGVRMVIDRK